MDWIRHHDFRATCKVSPNRFFFNDFAVRQALGGHPSRANGFHFDEDTRAPLRARPRELIDALCGVYVLETYYKHANRGVRAIELLIVRFVCVVEPSKLRH